MREEPRPGDVRHACMGRCRSHARRARSFGPSLLLQQHTRCTPQTFLRDNGLSLILRSHEGPDAREGRDDLGPMTEGYTIDHVTPAGRLITVFSAPDYPQFLPESQDRYCNKAALAVLRGPGYVDPEFLQYDAALPRPEVGGGVRVGAAGRPGLPRMPKTSPFPTTRPKPKPRRRHGLTTTWTSRIRTRSWNPCPRTSAA